VADALLALAYHKNPALMAAYELYEEDNDLDEFWDSLVHICRRKLAEDSAAAGEVLVCAYFLLVPSCLHL
jgi:hypothetical protein